MKTLSYLIPPVLTVLEEWRNILQCQIDLLEALADEVLPAAALSAARLSPVCRWRVELVDDAGRVVIMSSQDVFEPSNKALSDGAEYAQLTISPADLIFGHNIWPVHTLDSSEGMRLKAIARVLVGDTTIVLFKGFS